MRADFIEAMARAGSGVSVVTTDGNGGKYGITVSALAPLSADMPQPTLLVCINQWSPAADAIKANQAFAVNLLTADQATLADIFAGRDATTPNEEARFAAARWHTADTGSPILSDGLVAFDCKLYQQTQVGTHYIFIGAVVAIHNPNKGEPLVYAQRSYGRFEKSD